MTTTRTIDALGTWCPVPVGLLRRAAAVADEGDVRRHRHIVAPRTDGGMPVLVDHEAGCAGNKSPSRGAVIEVTTLRVRHLEAAVESGK